MSWDEDRRGLEQAVNAATGADPKNPAVRAASEMAGVGAQYLDSVAGLAEPLTTADGRPWSQMSAAEQGAAVLRRTQETVGTALGAMNVLQDMADVGFANLTAGVAALFPEFPAATLTDLYVGVPHAHAHPPSLIPPAPPLPLPSLGTILYGTCVSVLISSLPAARSGDIGVAPTCGGLAPFFQIKTGSSNVFIGGSRAARTLDVCIVCGKGEGRSLDKVEMAVGTLGIAADAADAATAADPAMAAANALSAAMGAAQLAADAVAMAMTAAMGTDPCTPPVLGPPGLGAVTTGKGNVIIGGFPMVNIPDPAGPLLNALKRLGKKAAKKLGGKCGKCGCP